MTEQAALKSWQHGIPMERLLAIEAIYADYNRFSVSPFSAVKKHTIAQLLHDRELCVLDRCAAYAMKRSKVTSPITIYNDVELARKRPHDLTISRLAGDHDRLRDALEQYRSSDTWASVWVDDAPMRAMLESSDFRRVGSKISTFGEVLAIYFRDSDAASLFAEPRQFAPISAAERVGIKRIGHVGSASLTNVLRDLDQQALTFTNHYSKYNNANAWSAIALRGFSPDPAFIIKPIEMNMKWHKEHQGEQFALQDTPLRAQFPDLDGLLAPYGDAFERIRFMQLAPGGGELERHTDQVDPDTGVRVGNNARIHIPIVTNPKVEFTSWDLENVPHVVNMRFGEVWYLDTRKPHRAINAGETARIHLVVDVIVTPRFISLLTS